jgi:hypothetical protein
MRKAAAIENKNQKKRISRDGERTTALHNAKQQRIENPEDSLYVWQLRTEASCRQTCFQKTRTRISASCRRKCSTRDHHTEVKACKLQIQRDHKSHTFRTTVTKEAARRQTTDCRAWSRGLRTIRDPPKRRRKKKAYPRANTVPGVQIVA